MARQQSSPTCVSLACFWLGIWPSFIRARRALEEGRGRMGRRRRWVWRSSPRHLRRHAASDGSVCSASLNATEKNSRLRPPSPSCACVLGCDHGTREHARVRAGEARTRDGYDAAGTGERCGGAEARSYSEGVCGGKHGRALEGQTWGADVDGHSLSLSTLGLRRGRGVSAMTRAAVASCYVRYGIVVLTSAVRGRIHARRLQIARGRVASSIERSRMGSASCHRPGCHVRSQNARSHSLRVRVRTYVKCVWWIARKIITTDADAKCPC